MTTDTTSAGMPPIASSQRALDVVPVQSAAIHRPAGVIRGFADEGMVQVTATLDGVAAAVRDIAAKLEGSGAAPFAGFVHQAADTVSGWSSAVHAKSVDDLLADTRTAVRTSPAVAVALSVAAGFVLSRLIKAAGTGQVR